jgi:hypothetical protein
MQLGPDLAGFIRLKRQLLRPEMIGLPDQQRMAAEVSHRSDVATAVGVSLAYYNRLERGRAHPSKRVLHALVLQIDRSTAGYDPRFNQRSGAVTGFGFGLVQSRSGVLEPLVLTRVYLR